jgi:hypothetical protein
MHDVVVGGGGGGVEGAGPKEKIDDRGTADPTLCFSMATRSGFIKSSTPLGN